MANDSLQQQVVTLLSERRERVVLAESCTGGLLSATLAKIPGVSNYLCGSFVTYREKSKRSWLGISKGLIDTCTTESQEVANEMAIQSLLKTPEATWSVAIVGHLGPDAPQGKDGVIYFAVARRKRGGNLKLCEAKQHRLSGVERVVRQHESVEVILVHFLRAIMRRSEKEQHKQPKKKAV